MGLRLTSEESSLETFSSLLPNGNQRTILVVSAAGEEPQEFDLDLDPDLTTVGDLKRKLTVITSADATAPPQHPRLRPATRHSQRILVDNGSGTYLDADSDLLSSFALPAIFTAVVPTIHMKLTSFNDQARMQNGFGGGPLYEVFDLRPETTLRDILGPRVSGLGTWSFYGFPEGTGFLSATKFLAVGAETTKKREYAIACMERKDRVLVIDWETTIGALVEQHGIQEWGADLFDYDH